MKKLIFSLAFMLVNASLWAQAPQVFNYQALARDAFGNPLPNQAVSFRISIKSGSLGGTTVYSETHTATTNTVGIANLKVGEGSVVSGSLSGIQWGSNSYYINVEFDPAGGTSFVQAGSAQLVSVPYALYSQNTGQSYNAGAGINISGNTITNTAPDQTVTLTPGTGISTGGTYPNFTINNTSPDQPVTLTPGTGISTSGTYPNFTITNALPNATHSGDATGSSALTVVKLQGKEVSPAAPSNGQALKWNGTAWAPAEDNNNTYTGGTGINVAGTTINNTAPDQNVTLTSGTGISTGGTYPNFTITNAAPDQTVSLTPGTGISTGGTYPNFTITNALPNATHSGDATGSSALTVVKLQGKDVSAEPPSSGQTLKWNGTAWAPAEDNNNAYTGGTGINVAGTTINNTAPDQNVTLTSGTGISTSGTYPNFTITNALPNATHSGDATGSSALTVVKLQGKDVSAEPPSSGQTLKWNGTAWAPAEDNNNTYTGGTGINVTGTTINNTAPDQPVTLTPGTGISTGGAYPNFTITNTTPDQPVTLTSGTGISTGGTYPNFTITNAAPDQTVSLTPGTGISTGGTYPTFTITNASPNATHSGDATGSSALTVVKLQGKDVSAAAPAADQVLQWNGTQWTPAALPPPPQAWLLNGNSGTSDTNFIGTVDNVPLLFRVNNQKAGLIDPIHNNTALGYMAGNANTTGHSNTAIGAGTLNSNTEGIRNVALGYASLQKNITGKNNTSVGGNSLSYNTTGDENTALGYDALNTNVTGYNNTAIGVNALANNRTACHNVAIGYLALYSQTYINDPTPWHSYNVALGDWSLYLNEPTTQNNGIKNTALGTSALSHNTTGSYNTATGCYALRNNATADGNTANGYGALYNNITGSKNVAVGYEALYSQSYDNDATPWNTNNVALGYHALYSNNPISNTSGLNNTAIGTEALYSNTIGYNNTATGSQALYSNYNGVSNTATGLQTLYSNTSGAWNTATGWWALYSNTFGCGNTANGSCALLHNNGFNNVAVGSYALMHNSSASGNVAVGADALYDQVCDGAEYYTFNVAVGYGALKHNNPTSVNNGKHNTALGTFALIYNTTGSCNTATGSQSLEHNLTGYWNTATGDSSLHANTTGYRNTATGKEALSSNETGTWNTATGAFALASNTSGVSNTAMGDGSLQYNSNGEHNTAVGDGTLRLNQYGSGNVALGFSAGYNYMGSNQLFIDNSSTSTPLIHGDFSSDALTVNGSLKVTNLPSGSGTTLVADASGNLKKSSSSLKYKKDVAELTLPSDKIFDLTPVSFTWKSDNTSDFGLIAEEVNKVIPELVIFDENGNPDAVKYMQLSVLLLQELKILKTRLDELTAEVQLQSGKNK